MNWGSKAAALGVVATLVVAVPLVNAIQRKEAEIAVAKVENAGMDPVRTAVLLQRHLQAHRGLSSMVLNGNDAAERDRIASQGDASAQFPVLERQLAERGLARATEEARAMKSGWETLCLQIVARSISAPESFAAHCALVEQNIGVIDMVAQATGQTLGRARSERAVLVALLVGLGGAAVAQVVLALRRRPAAAPPVTTLDSGGDSGTDADTQPATAASRLLERMALRPAAQEAERRKRDPEIS